FVPANNIEFFKVATFCFDDCFAHSWHSLDELQEVITGNGLHFTGILCLIGPSKATIRSGNSMTVRCVYDEGYEDYIKYWCKGESSSSCIIQIKTETHKKEVSMGRFTIKDTPATHSFNVTMENMRVKDSDIYYCGIERNLKDNMHMMKVEVLPGVCPITAPWTDIVDFSPKITEIEVDQAVEVSCQRRYQQKNITLQCREASGEFVLSPQSDGDYCVGVCRKAPPWSHVVDFPENFTEIAVNGSVLVYCPQSYGGMTFRLQCQEESGEFLLSEADGPVSCVDNKTSTLTNQASSLLTSSFGFVVPFFLKLAALLVSLMGKISWILLRRLWIYREELEQRRSLQGKNANIQQKTCGKKENDDVSHQRVEMQEIYQNLTDEFYTIPPKK
ncbi:uncharacterized protein, partial [Phyllobates terribilis]|uniref:uncharacterized protein n=1 Tax=Phyllobates terribilis TaxID=111132 RepID=UPI003CCB32B0